jgi:hypothetical protein
MQTNDNRGSLSDKFRDFGAKPSDGMWDAISDGLDAVKPVQPTAPKAPNRSLFWAATGFLTASVIATAIWLMHSNDTPASPAGTVPATAEQTHSSEPGERIEARQASDAPGNTSAASSSKAGGAEKNNYRGGSSKTHRGEKTASGNKQQRAAGAAGSSRASAGKQDPGKTAAVTARQKKLQRSAGQKERSRTPVGALAKNSSPKRTKRDAGRGKQTSVGIAKNIPAVSKNNSGKDQQATGENTAPSSGDGNTLSPSLPSTNPGSDPDNGSGDPGKDATTNEKPDSNFAVAPPNEAGNDSIPPADSLANNGNGTETTISPLTDSSPSENPAAAADRRVLPPNAPKWMISGHFGLAYSDQVYLINGYKDQYTASSDISSVAYPSVEALPTRVYRSADILVSRRLGRRFWIESGLQGGMLVSKQESEQDYSSAYLALEGTVFNLGIPLAMRFDFVSNGRVQIYQRIGTLHTFPYAINARYQANPLWGNAQPDITKRTTYWTYTLSTFCNLGMEWQVVPKVYWDIRAEVRFITQMNSMYQNYHNSLWIGGSTGVVWKF